MEKNRAHPGRPWRPQEDQAVAHAWHDLVETARATVRDGLVVGTLKPTSELPLHLAVYRTGTARAVVHTHAPHATAVSTLVDTLPPVHYMAAALGGPVRTAPYALYGSQELAGHLVEALRDRTACLLRNHGTVTTGDTLTQALDRTAQLEWMCRVWLLARSVPGHTPSLLDAGQLDAAAERLRGYGQPGG
ncbi:class II aldolase/adducin family protein [Streptomyces albidoflavus]